MFYHGVEFQKSTKDVAMRRSAFTTILAPRTCQEAEKVIGLLREAGLHPADLGLSVPLALPGRKRAFPVQVPSEESEAARKLLKSR
jgi:hypothetical protein